MKATDDHGKLFESVQSRIHALMEGVLAENEKLRNLAKGLQLDNELLGLRLSSLEHEILENRKRHDLLEEQLLESQKTAAVTREQYFEVEQQNLKLTSLYVATYQLGASTSRHHALTNIQEILANLIGTEDYAIYERDGDDFVRVLTTGERDAPRRVIPGEGTIGCDATSPEITFRKFEDFPDSITPIVSIPLRLGSDVVGLIAVFGFLLQKTEIDRMDEELYELLATHAANALRSSGSRAGSSLVRLEAS